MIVKVIEHEKGESSFSRLGHYILEAQQENAAIVWTRTADYIMDVRSAGNSESGDKVAWFEITNCQSDIPGSAMTEIMVIQSLNKTSKNDKTYHLVVSFPEDASVTREQLKDIEETICKGLGFEGHQRLSACHINTENTHLHIAINKVHPKSLRCVEPFYSYYKLDELCRLLEMRHNLKRDNRIKEGQINNPEVLKAEKESLIAWFREMVTPALKNNLTNWKQVHETLASFGLEIKPRGGRAGHSFLA